jgi:phospholipid/cholesterol/gamma-HCH transport system ATP-binding protein
LDFTLRRHFKDLTESEINTEINEVLESVGLSEAIDKMPPSELLVVCESVLAQC